MSIQDKALALSRKFKLDAHHAIERFGVFVGIFAVTGAAVLAGSGVASFTTGRDALSQTALYTQGFVTSKTDLGGDVDGVYTNTNRDKALVMMHFDKRAQISYNAADYQAFLLGSDTSLNSEAVSTEGIQGSFHVFGSTGYVGVLLDATQPFDRQVLNLTVRANAELSVAQQDETANPDELGGDQTFARHDQWRVFVNPGASGAEEIPALDSLVFDPARAYYDVVLKAQETVARGPLDQKLVEMRTSLAQIEAYTTDLSMTKVDGLFLRPPPAPASLAGDEVTGVSSAEAKDGVSTLTLETDHVVPGGFDLDWRSGNVYDGYLDALVPSGQSYAELLAAKLEEGRDIANDQVGDMQWTLSDGSSLTEDYQPSDLTMRPLTNVMNNLSRAYQDYATGKAEYQSELLLELLRLEVELRDVRSNSTVRDDPAFLTTLY
ncbi:hypothetical protein C8K30_1011004 [Promicromonospora sp. AC04]|uniref:hypothetical protein n=1 Tax=Promicromonospora sp. AC04 TaxID=2135723 RepID=UPI000D3C3FCB|nr:hypothetical protein [Promicromonospora sp. AC04]PUB32478.1 hypothetical protein C8K30_1011004 [Promicromonospora sp. AC04]